MTIVATRPTVRIFLDTRRNDPYGVTALNSYYPYWLDQAAQLRNPAFDTWSCQIHNLNCGDQRAVAYFVHHISSLLGADFAITSVPSLNPAITMPGIRLVARALANGTRIDATSCLVRHTFPGHNGLQDECDFDQHLTTITVEQAHLFRGRSVLLLDSIISTGGALLACRDLLIRAGAAQVQCVALGRMMA